MAKFRPPEYMRKSTGEFHILDEIEVNYIELCGIVEWNKDDQVFELAPDKTWNDYVEVMNEIDPPFDPLDTIDDSWWNDGSDPK